MGNGDDKIKLEHVKHALESRRQLRQATINFEHASLRVLFLLNGGGLIAFLTFLGTEAGKGLENKWTICTLISWLVGLALAGLATGFGYQSQLNFYKAHGRYQQALIDLREYPVDENLTKNDLENKAKTLGSQAHCQRAWAHYFGIASLVVFALGAGLSIVGYFP